MAITLLNKASYQESLWSGGKTSQIAIEPANALYADRDFIWRLSSATVELEESNFTPLPDYNRLISTLTGTIELHQEREDKVVLNPFGIHGFDGGINVRSIGRCTDFNLMLRKLACSGSLEAIRLAEKAQFSFTPTVSKKTKKHAVVLYCYQGDISINILGKIYQLTANSTLVLSESDANQTLSINAHSQSNLMLAEIIF